MGFYCRTDDDEIYTEQEYEKVIQDSHNVINGAVLEYHICIVGAGAAGITLANELSFCLKDICIIEGGGLDYTRKTQKLYCGELSGDRYFPLYLSRLRYYGGSTNHWGGASLPLDENDFTVRDWIPNSGWPITLRDIESYYLRASDFLQLNNYSFEFESNNAEKNNSVADKLFNRVLKYSTLDMGKFGLKYIDKFKHSDNVTVFTNCSAVKLVRDKDSEKISHVSLKNLDGKSFSVKAGFFILAMGGIENPRLLLVSEDKCRKAIGNSNDLVGRYFMDHIFYYSGFFKFKNDSFRKAIHHFIKDDSRKQDIVGLISPEQNFLESNRISNCNTYLMYRNPIKLGEDYNDSSCFSAIYIKDDLLKCRLPVEFLNNIMSVLGGINNISNILLYYLINKFRQDTEVVFRTCIEQAPDPDNRVMLSDKVDDLGVKRVLVNWRIGELEKKTIGLYHNYLVARLNNLHIGDCVMLGDKELDINYGPGHHHMGTTKMGNHPGNGVVDTDCKVFGTSNLYVAGSSVFPTGGVANPTMTIIALALKLTDHIKTKSLN